MSDEIIREQPATAVYTNPHGDLVIRRALPYPDQGVFITIAPRYVAALVDATLAEVGAVDERDS